MNTKLLACLCLLTVAALTTGCGVAPPRLQLDQASDGRAVTVRCPGTVTVTLPSNASTGYQWKLAQAGVLENAGHTYESGTSGLAGAPGTEKWEFNARRCGTGALRLEYRRPWEPAAAEPAKSFAVTVTVVGSAGSGVEPKGDAPSK